MMSVSQVARATDLTPDTIRYYGRLGLLPEAGRTPGGHRYFDEEAIERVRFIRGAQWFDLRLEEIRELLDVADHGLCACQQTRSLLERKIAAIEAQRSRLDHIHAVLSQLLGSVGEDGAEGVPVAQASPRRDASCPCDGGRSALVNDVQRFLARRNHTERQRGSTGPASEHQAAAS